MGSQIVSEIHSERNDKRYSTIEHPTKETMATVESPPKIVKKVAGIDPDFIVMNPNSVKKVKLAEYLENKKKARKFGEKGN